MAERSNSIKTLMAILAMSSPVAVNAQPAAKPPAPPSAAAPSAPANTEDRALARANVLHDIIASNADTLVLYWTCHEDGKASFISHVPEGNPQQIGTIFDKLTNWGSNFYRAWIIGSDKLPDSAIADLQAQTTDLNKAMASANVAMANATFQPERLITTHPFVALMGTIQLEKLASSEDSKDRFRNLVLNSLRKGRDNTLDLNEKSESEILKERQAPTSRLPSPGPAFGPPPTQDMRLSQPI